MLSESSYLVLFLHTIHFVTGTATGNHNEFGYHGDKGPTHWADDPRYHSCAGKMQSPINIEETAVNKTRFPPLRFKGFGSLPVASVLSNNGHTVMLSITPTEEITVSGGPLRGEYTFAQLHFHWGANDSMGSEDMINGHSFPMELHMVFYKTDYGSVEKSMMYKDGLTVLAVFYNAYDFDNSVYSEIVEHLDIVVMPNTNVRLHSPLTLDELLPANTHIYFTYQGSLTTPPCSEVVTWIDFQEPIPLSHYQINKFRRLQSLEGAMLENFRPVQPVGDRLIFHNIGERPSHHTHRHFGAEAPLSELSQLHSSSEISVLCPIMFFYIALAVLSIR